MTDIVVAPELENNAWPIEFSSAWINKFINHRNRICFGLYFNNQYSEGYILEGIQEEQLPDAYIVIDQDGEILDIFVKKNFRGQRIGTMLCAWTRSNLLQDNIITKAPPTMTDAGKGLYEYISNIYGEPYDEPTGSPMFLVYSDFNGGMEASFLEKN